MLAVSGSTMSSQCPACHSVFTQSGLKHHQRLTQDPLCRRYWENRAQSDSESDTKSNPSNSDALSSDDDDDLDDDDDDPFPTIIFGPAVERDDVESDPEPFTLGIDPTGDALGDYDSLDEDDFEMGSASDSGESLLGELEETDDDFEEEDESSPPLLEPHRPTRQSGSSQAQEMSAEEEAALAASRLQRDGAEQQLQYTPHKVMFPSPAGDPIGTSGSQNNAYASGIPTANNPYAPFVSRIDWEVARWAKLRGPGSTALTELLQIPEASGFICDQTAKSGLNCII